MIAVAITFKDIDSAKKFSRNMLEKKLVACCNFFPVESMYLWEGDIQQEHEILMLCKSSKEKYSKIKDFAEKNHPYDIPLVESWDIDNINLPYINWLKKEITGGDR